jgi:hypothetical protein
LWLLQPEYADLIPAEDKFERALRDAGERLFIPEQFTLQ